MQLNVIFILVVTSLFLFRVSAFSSSIDVNVIETKDLDLFFTPVNDANFDIAVNRSVNFLVDIYPVRDNGVNTILDTNPINAQQSNPSTFDLLDIRFKILNRIFLSKQLFTNGVGIIEANYLSNIGATGVNIMGDIILVDETQLKTLSHEVGHTFDFCEEYNMGKWHEQNNKLLPNGCPNGDLDNNGSLDQICLDNNGCPTSTFPELFSSYGNINESTILRNIMGGTDSPDFSTNPPSNFETWISSDSYNVLLERFDTNSNFTTPLIKFINHPFSYIITRIFYEKNGTIEIIDSYQLESGFVNNASASRGNFSISLLNSTGGIISNISFEPNFIITTENGTSIEINKTFLIFALPTNENLSKIRFKNNAQVLKEVNRTTNTPSIELITNLTGKKFARELFNVSWNASDADNDTLAYAILFSADNGGNFSTLEIDYQNTSITLNSLVLGDCGQCRVKVLVTDGINTNSTTSGAFEINNTPAQIGIKLITPFNISSTINVTQNKFFNITVNVSCPGTVNCGEINVSFDPIGKEVRYTPTSDIVCENGICTKTFYSGIRNVFEDGKWKRIENARSLWEKGFEIVYLEKDPEFPIYVYDFNLTAIEVYLDVNEKHLNKDIPIRIWKRNWAKEKSDNFKEDHNLIVETTTRFVDVEDEQNIVLEFGLDTIIEFGFNSTTITLQEADTENLEDGYFDENSTVNGTETTLLSDFLNGGGKITFIKFNIDSIPDNANVLNATLKLYANTGSDNNLDIWYSNNKSWREETIDSLCSNGTVCSTVYNMFTNNLRSYNGTGLDNRWENISNLQSAVQTELDSGNKNVTFILNNTNSDISDFYGFRSKEHTTVSQRPILEIVYTKGLISTTIGDKPFYTNQSNPRTINLSAGQSQIVTAFVNATGDTGIIHEFFVFVNKTSDMSVFNITDKWNVSIVTPIVQGTEQEFFENCSSINDWTNPDQYWEATLGDDCEARDTEGVDGHMISSAIDLSGETNINLSFIASTGGLDSGEYFRVYANSTSNSWTKVFELTGFNTSRSYTVVLGNYINFTSNVHVRGTCNNDGSSESCRWDSINVTSYG